MRSAILIIAVLAACEAPCEAPNGEVQTKRLEREAWEGPCKDQSVLVATTAGSPNGFTCPNREHRMRVQTMTTSSNEEIGALVFCECYRPGQLPVVDVPAR